MMQQPYQHKPYYFHREGVGFHFLAPPPEDIRAAKYLYGDDPEDALCSILAHAQEGDFAPCQRLIELMQLHDRATVWYACGKLLAYAAPKSLLQELLATFAEEVSEEASTAKWLGWILGLSGSLWAVPEMLRLFSLHPPGRTLVEKTREWWIPDYLSLLLEDQDGVIRAGAVPSWPPRDPAWPEWLNSEDLYDPVYDDEGYRQEVMRRYQAARSKVADPEQNAISRGELLSLRRLAQYLLDVLPGRHSIYHDEEIWLDILEAYTGLDVTSHSEHPPLVVKQVEQFLAHPGIERYEPGVRYFFGHRIPD
ncbi:MAG TPA: hypothetical protein VKT82_03940 [Ktedonobacterales bacterium]|nr:hypothetical protein [Ktedonobacterales bacterium]